MKPRPASEIDTATRRNARTAVPAALARIRAAGIEVEEGNDHVTVAGAFLFYPSLGYWREIGGKRHGYDAASLIAAAQQDQRLAGTGMRA